MSSNRVETHLFDAFQEHYSADHAEVDAFCKAAVNAGGKSKKAPQAWPEYYPGYYATWVFDPDGHDIEVVRKS
jgi:predicted lactoylglutathione lyase